MTEDNATRIKCAQAIVRAINGLALATAPDSQDHNWNEAAHHFEHALEDLGGMLDPEPTEPMVSAENMRLVLEGVRRDLHSHTGVGTVLRQINVALNHLPKSKRKSALIGQAELDEANNLDFVLKMLDDFEKVLTVNDTNQRAHYEATLKARADAANLVTEYRKRLGGEA